MWLIYAASDTAIEKLSAPLTLETEQAAKNLPSAKEMIDQIGKRVGQGVPAAAHGMLSQFKDVSWNAMNSFVHGGIHPLRRSADGFPVHLALQVLRNSNGLSTMTGMTMAVLTGDESIVKPMSKIQPGFHRVCNPVADRAAAACGRRQPRAFRGVCPDRAVVRPGLSRSPFDLLALLAERAGRVLSRDQLIEALKGGMHEPFDRSIDVHIARLRAMIEDDPKDPKRILTVRGTGYVRSGLGQRLYVRIYLALLISLVVAAVLFGLAHRGYGAMPITVPGARAHVSMLGLLMVIAMVVALASYPVVRRLTRGLERLEASVGAWGAGDLSARVAVEGRDEVARLAVSFNEAAARVEALMSAQKTLLANASHELRSPRRTPSTAQREITPLQRRPAGHPRRPRKNEPELEETTNEDPMDHRRGRDSRARHARARAGEGEIVSHDAVPRIAMVG
eukprot:gene39395-53261_t